MRWATHHMQETPAMKPRDIEKAHVPDLHGTQEESSALIAKKYFRHALLQKKATNRPMPAEKTDCSL